MRVRIVTAMCTAVLAGSWMAEPALAQCAMCVTALEQNGGEMAAGFNRGILFMLAMPYLVFATIGISWYLKRKRRRFLEAVPASE